MYKVRAQFLISLLALAVLMAACAQPMPTPPSGQGFGPQLPAGGVTPTPVVAAQVGQPSPPDQPAPRPPSSQEAAPIKLTLMYTNDTRGFTDPCG